MVVSELDRAYRIGKEESLGKFLDGVGRDKGLSEQKLFFLSVIVFISTFIYNFNSFLQGWVYLAFSSPSAPNPVFIAPGLHLEGNEIRPQARGSLLDWTCRFDRMSYE
jgi:hypothetical protein